MPNDKKLNGVIINVLSKEQYDSVQNPSTDEFWLVPDEIDTVPVQGSTNPITSGAVYEAFAQGSTGVTFVTSFGVAGNGTSGSYLSSRWYCSDVNGITTPYDGMMIAMKIPIAGVGTAGVVISINGNNNEDYHPVLYSASTTLTTHYPVGSMMIFTYDSSVSATRYLTSNTGTSITGCWKCIADYDSTNIYQLRNYYGNYTALTAVTRYSLLVQHSPTHLMSISSGSGTSGHVYDTTNEFDPFGMIYYVNVSTANYLSAGASISASVLYQHMTLDIRYTFNESITTGKDLYLVAIPQANGRAKLSETPIAQDLPSTNDGKIYILLGHSYSTTQIELHVQHPIYYHDGTAIRLWTNPVNVASEIQQQLTSMAETWTFTLSDNSTVTKDIVVVPQNNS